MTALSTHFTLRELTTTSTGLLNVPGPEAVAELRRLCNQVLEPWRLVIGPIAINSGYRSPAVNRAVGGSRSSDHMLGRAADCRPLAVPLETAWRTLVALAPDLLVDQAIFYVRKRGAGWIHVSRRDVPRRELLVNVDGGYRPWSEYRGPLVLP